MNVTHPCMFRSSTCVVLLKALLAVWSCMVTVLVCCPHLLTILWFGDDVLKENGSEEARAPPDDLVYQKKHFVLHYIGY
jgi:hypothetical protein